MNATLPGPLIAIKKMREVLAFIICVALGGLHNGFAADAPRHGQLADADYKFLSSAAHWNVIELALGHLGVQQGTDANVRAFGQRMTDFHQQTGSALTLLATQKGVDLPEIGTLDERKQFTVAKLAGAQFDQAYLEYMIADKKRDVDLFQNEAAATDDPDLKAWAGKMLPVAQGDLKAAQDIYASLTVTAGKN